MLFVIRRASEKHVNPCAYAIQKSFTLKNRFTNTSRVHKVLDWAVILHDLDDLMQLRYRCGALIITESPYVEALGVITIDDVFKE